MSVIEHDTFLANNPMDLVLLESHVIRGPAELPGHNAEQLNGADRFVVNTIINLNEEGSPLDIYLSVFRAKKILKVQASRLFPHEGPEQKFLQMEIDYQGFHFPPSRLCSDWVASRNLGVKLMKTKNKAHGFHEMAEWGTFGVGEFMCRLAVEPAKEPDQAIVRLHAIPGNLDDLSTFRGRTEDTGYPVINLMEDVGAVMCNVMTEPPLREDGAPFYPFIVWPGTLSADSLPQMNANQIRLSMYSLWSAPHGSVFSKTHRAWHQLAFPAGSGDPRSDAVSAAYAWPPLRNVSDDADATHDFDSDTDREFN